MKSVVVLWLLCFGFLWGQAPGNALNFDGVDDYAALGVSDDFFTISNQFSVELWANANDWTPESTQTLISCAVASGLSIYLSGGKLFGKYFDDNPAGYRIVDYTLGNDFSGWHHIALTFDGRYLRMYLDGVLVKTYNRGLTGGDIRLNGSEMFLGVHFGPAFVDYYNGSIDNLRIWNETRTPKEIIQNMYADLTSHQHLMGVYKFDASAGTSLTESTGNQSAGVLYNMDDSDWIGSTPYTVYTGGSMINSGSWSKGLPNSTLDAVIPIGTNANLIGSLEVNGLAINEGASLEIENLGDLTVYGAIFNAGSLDIKKGGDFIQEASSSFKLSGSTSVATVGNGNLHVYHYLGSPYPNHDMNFGTNRFYYDPSAASGVDEEGLSAGWRTVNAPMVPGKGYICRSVSNITYVGVDEVFNNGNINVPVSLATYTGHNLLSNPYPSAVNTHEFMNVNGSLGSGVIGNTIWLWNHDQLEAETFDGSDYATYNTSVGGVAGGNGDLPGGHIGIAQGFFVEANTSGTVSFTNDMRSTQNSQFFKADELEFDFSRVWIDFKNDVGVKNQILLALNDAATDAYDLGYESEKLNGNNHLNFYSKIKGSDEAFVIQSLDNNLTQEKRIPLFVSTDRTALHIFKIGAFDLKNDEQILLYDKENQHEYNLRMDSVQVLLGAGLHDNRFEIVFRQSGVTSDINDDELSDQLQWYAHGNELIFFGEDIEFIDMKMYSLLGDLVLTSNTRCNGELKLNHQLPSGMYIVQIETANGKWAQKIKI